MAKFRNILRLRTYLASRNAVGTYQVIGLCCAATVLFLKIGNCHYQTAVDPTIVRNQQKSNSTTEQISLPLKYPTEEFDGECNLLPPDINPEKLLRVDPVLPLVERGTFNVAKFKPVTSSTKALYGALTMLVDGDKSGTDDSLLILPEGMQWVQIDLQSRANISYIAVWHRHQNQIVVRSVIIQISDDPKFKFGVSTVFNSDIENIAGLGIGNDRLYYETYRGKLMNAHGASGRYVRLYSGGTTYRNPGNFYNEVEVYGKPVPDEKIIDRKLRIK